MRLRSLGLLAVIALVVASCGGAQPEASAPSEGIVVHGDWTIDIYNPDGSLDQHTEFSNALGPNGGNSLAGFLVGQATPGMWLVRLYGSDTNGPCKTYEPSFGTCALTASAVNNSDGSLTVTASGTAENDGEIATVDTKIATCGNNVTPADCPAAYDPLFDDTGSSLTEKDLTAPETVSAGQSIQVEVVISFTSG
ncbi:MAG: hypothetical protein WB245_02455 [Acidimicrobiia bacterium]